MQKTSLLIAASLSLAGCGSMPKNTSMYSAHQPVIERTNFTIDVAFDGNGIASVDRQRLNEWLDALELRYGDRISVDGGRDYASVGAAQDVRTAAAERGIIVADNAPATSGVIAPGNIRIVVTRSSASVPSCPDWSTTHEHNYRSANHSNHGCATNSNLAAMVADPEDLVRGRESKRTDRNSGKAAVNAYKAKTGGN